MENTSVRISLSQEMRMKLCKFERCIDLELHVNQIKSIVNMIAH